ncbi:hypothetical protein ACFSYH_10450 [Populibacterium corticicola]|uniref:Uncharacterized protein n=1 Tax=Populibacterium corticicola TaxID=1812826 RepID=A0ABW5XJE6_9MICO
MSTKTLDFTTDLDPVLGPVLYTHKHSSARSAVLAILVKVLASGSPSITPRLARRWLASRAVTLPDVMSIVGPHSPSWTSLVAAARKHVLAVQSRSSLTSSTTSPSPASIAMARRLVGWLGSAVIVGGVEVRGTRAVGARVATAIQGVRILENLAPSGNQIDSPILSRAELAVRTGWSLPTSGQHLKAAIGWSMKQVGRRPVASGQACRLKQMRGQATVAADDRTELIDALARMDRTTNPTVAVILAVAHPVFSYGLLSHLHWAALLSQAMDLDHETLGLSQRTMKRLARELDRAGVHAGSHLTGRLDELARELGLDDGPSAMDQYAAARQKRAEEAAARKAEIMANRAKKAEAFKAGRAESAGKTALRRSGGE